MLEDEVASSLPLHRVVMVFLLCFHGLEQSWLVIPKLLKLTADLLGKLRKSRELD
jgi:hypothetical protein